MNTLSVSWSTLFYLSPLLLIVPLSAVSYVLIQHKIKQQKVERIEEITKSKYLSPLSLHHAEVVNGRSISDYFIPVALATIVTAGGLFSTFIVGGAHASAFLYGHEFSALGEATNSTDTLDLSIMAIAWSFMGAFTFALQNVFRRYVSFDLYPRVYYDIVIRVLYAVSLALLVRFLFEDFAKQPIAPAVFFIIGVFPERGLVYLENKVSLIPGFQKSKDESAKNYPLSMIEGLSLLHRSRLKELGIDNVQNLAVYDFIELLIRTPFNPETVASWIGAAKLTTLFGTSVQALHAVGINDVIAFKHSVEDEKLGIDTLAALTEISRERLEIAYQQIIRDPFIRIAVNFACVQKRARTEQQPQGERLIVPATTR